MSGGHTRLPTYAAGATGADLRHARHPRLARQQCPRLGEAPEPLYAVVFPAPSCGRTLNIRVTRSCWICGKATWRPLHDRPEPAFEAPWHAQLFALTVHLNEAGHFAWGDWAERFSAHAETSRLSRELNGGEDYFHAWLETLEGLFG